MSFNQIAEIESMQEDIRDLLESEAITMRVTILASEKNVISRQERDNLWGSSHPFTEGLRKIYEKLEKLKVELKQNVDPDNVFQRVINFLKERKAQ